MSAVLTLCPEYALNAVNQGVTSLGIKGGYWMAYLEASRQANRRSI